MAIFSYWIVFISSYVGFSTVGARDYSKSVANVFDDSKVEITSNSPAVLDSTISFFVKLKDEDPKNYYLYRYDFHDDTTQETRNEIAVRDIICNYNVSYSSLLNSAGNFTMEVRVYVFMIILWVEIGSKSTTFTLTTYINGNLNVYNNNQIDKSVYFPTGSPLNLTFTLYDPNQFFSHDSIYYNWMVNDKLIDEHNKSILYNFSKTGEQTISVFVVAKTPVLEDNMLSFSGEKWGTFNKLLTLREPIPRINYTGSLWIKHGNLLELNIFCNGSSPFRYCNNASTSRPPSNFTCDASIMYDACQFTASYYFPCCNQYYYSIYIANDVSQMRKTLMITVYDISHDPGLSVTILPIICVVLVVIMLVAAIAYYKQQQRKYRVEVADFDFTQVEQMVERTFFERIYEEFKNALRPSSSRNREYDGVQTNFISFSGRNRTRRYGAVC
ncbi:transmembrane protein 130-like [Centruroides sculpturatus]|uniref:transmembrane protein 130-like n=1 Tax=Centruroides sculpturatus TaxID=218467 RepID=UPI000C6CE270|nr:transmembrane protein 130-like [Centruroides sculpturatus]